MSLLKQLLAEIAEEEGDMSREELEQLESLLKRRAQKQATGAIRRSEPIDDEFPVGPNAAMAIERRQRAARERREADAALVRRETENLGPAHRRGLEMYGHETPAEAEARWREQEQRDLDGTYGPGGATAGGIFGDGTIAMPDYDPAAHARGGVRMGPAVQLKTLEILERISERLERMGDGQQSQALPGEPRKQLPRRK